MRLFVRSPKIGPTPHESGLGDEKLSSQPPGRRGWSYGRRFPVIVRISLTVGLALVVATCTSDGADTSTSTSARTAPVSTTATSLPTITMTSPPVPADTRRPVIFDYSPTVSDLGALAFLAAHPDLRLIAVTLPGTGESYCEPGVAHTRGVLIQLGLSEVPVACGPDEPLAGFNAFPTSWRVASSEMELPEAEPNETRSAAELIVDLVRSSETPVEIIAVGPLTNLALALEADPGIATGVAGITIMGGAVDVPGNVFRNDVAEWNIWVDPTAAGVVLASGAPVTLIPLDATNSLPSGRIFFDSLDDVAETAESVLVRDVWKAHEAWIDNPDGFFYFWDELAAAVLADESLVTFETRNLVVDDDLRENKGWTREHPTGTPIRVALTADRLAFETLFLETIVGGPAKLGYLEPTEGEVAYFEAITEISMDFDTAFEEMLQATASELGFSQDSLSDEEFLIVLGATLPKIFDGPGLEEVQRLEAIEPPSTLAAAHQNYLAARRAFHESRDDILAAFDAAPGFEVFGPFFEDATTACIALQQEADRRLINIDLLC